MATSASSAATQKAQPTRDNATKRKQSISDDDSGSDSDADSQSSPNKKSNATSTGKVSASQQLVPVPGQPDAPLITKRTLQNRKAQREFRKRREARVRELEERCRRFDQMGLEANTELQRLARRLKDENEALKSLVARLGFAHMIPGIVESLNGPEPHHAQHPHMAHSGPLHHHPRSFAPLDMGMDTWARGPGMPLNTAAMQQINAPADNATAIGKPPKRNSSVSNASASVPTSAPFSSLPKLPGLTGLLPVTAGGVNPSLFSGAGNSSRNKRTNEGVTPAIAVPATNNKSTTTARPIEENTTFDSDWFAQLAQSGQDKEEADSTAANAASNNTNDSNGRSMNPIVSLSFGNNNNNEDSNSQAKSSDNSSALTGSAMLGANARDFGLGLASALGIAASSAPGNNIFPVPMPTQQKGALLNPNPIPFAFNLSDNKAPGDQSWWSQVAGNTLEGDDSILDEKAQAVAQATGASNNGAPSPFDLSAFLNGGLTPGGGGFTFGSQQSNDDDANDALKSNANNNAGNNNNDTVENNGKSGETQSLTQAEHAQMFLRLLEAKMAKRSTSPYAQLGFQPPSHHQQYTTSQAGPSFSDASSSSSSSSAAKKEDDDSSLSPINVYSRLAQHPAFLSTNASELEELVDSISSNQQRQQQQQPIFQPLFNKRKATPTKAAPALYSPTPSGLTPSIYGSNGAASLSSRSASSSSGKELEVDENAVTKMLGLLDRKTSRDAAAATGGLAF
ncbi:uncharacterized protein UHOD_07028 [Ustilago sp. UG-2017b]|nr:uncharacterized protein UHOD_07028 [Ustilago sp. UG-2017b]